MPVVFKEGTLATGVKTAEDVRSVVVSPTDSRVVVSVPQLPPGAATLVVVTAAGTQSTPAQLIIAAPVRIATLEVTAGTLRITGYGLAPGGMRSDTVVTVGESSNLPLTWEGDQVISTRIPATEQGGRKTVKVANYVGEATGTVVLP